jgi:hypothetical protein
MGVTFAVVTTLTHSTTELEMAQPVTMVPVQLPGPAVIVPAAVWQAQLVDAIAVTLSTFDASFVAACVIPVVLAALARLCAA